MKLKIFLSFCCALFCTVAQAQTDNTALYRTINGEYNHETNRRQGAAHTALIRYAGDGFVDGQSIPAGPNRPNPRTISNTLFAQEGLLNDPVGLSDYTWVFGQFIDHDLSLTEGSQEVMPIRVPAGDPAFDPFFFGSVVIPFSRNPHRPGTGFGVGNPRNYNNDITAYLDGSGVYGSDLGRANWLRTFTDGRLKVSSGDLLPYNTMDGEVDGALDPAAPHMADDVGASPVHFVAGDVRANENPLLLSFHTLFVREHNRQCERLKTEHPDWTDEQLYQHARKRVGGLIQSIVYNEWLPAMGVPVADYPGYDPGVNPQLGNAFTAAAFRVGHTLLNGNIRRLDANGRVLEEGNMTLRDAFFNTTVLAETGLDPFLRGMAEQTQQRMDSRVVDDVRNFLFGPPGAGGLDLAAINIMRGRERGLPSYNNIRRAYGLSTHFNFDEINPDFEVYNTLEELYEGDIEEVDPWVAMLAERPMSGSIFGPTIRKIMEKQFSDLRAGDRFFFANDPVLTGEEKDRINNTTFRNLIQRNSDIDLMQDNVFEAMSFSDICGQMTTSADGLVHVHTSDLQLPDVSITANGADGEVMDAKITTDLGFFEFTDLPACQDLTISASLAGDWSAGIDVFDMVAINLHLLGRQEFANPYQYLAADVTGDGEIDVRDIVGISRQVLGFTERFAVPQSEPWFFVPGGYEFVNPDFPFLEDVPHSIDFAVVEPAEINQGFVAIKLGDVNADAALDGSNRATGLTVNVPHEAVTVGEHRQVKLLLSGDDVAGFQLGLATSGLRILGVARTDLPGSAYRVAADGVSVLKLEEGRTEHQLVLDVVAERAGLLSDMFTLSSDERSVVVDMTGSPRSIHLGAATDADEAILKSRAYPNPFSDVVTVKFATPLASAATLRLHDVFGRSLRTQSLSAGSESVRLAGLDLPSGAYLLRITDSSGAVILVQQLESLAR